MHAEYAFGSAEAPEGLGPVVVPICATFAPDEPPQAEARNDSPATPATANARNATRFGRDPFDNVSALGAGFAIWALFQLTDLCV
jgi:hypothetical protein